MNKADSQRGIKRPSEVPAPESGGASRGSQESNSANFFQTVQPTRGDGADSVAPLKQKGAEKQTDRDLTHGQ